MIRNFFVLIFLVLAAACDSSLTPEQIAANKKIDDQAKKAAVKLAEREKKEQAEAAARQARALDPLWRKKILSGLKADKDEFKEVTFYKHPGTPVLGSHIYFYIAESGIHYTLRMVAQYEGEDWVFWDKLIFKVDDQVFRLEPGRSEVDRENSSGTVWETMDIPVISGNAGQQRMDFEKDSAVAVAALMKAKTASMRFDGQRVSDRKIPSPELARLQGVGKKFISLLSGEE